MSDQVKGVEKETMGELRLYSQNIRSISKNFDKLQVATRSSVFQVVCCQETWKVSTQYTLLNYYKPYNIARAGKNRGGGVITWVKLGQEHVRRTDMDIFIDNVYESLCVELKTNKKNIVVVNIYKPPKTSTNDFAAYLTMEFSKSSGDEGSVKKLHFLHLQSKIS